jgi:hypothetical protein
VKESQNNLLFIFLNRERRKEGRKVNEKKGGRKKVMKNRIKERKELQSNNGFLEINNISNAYIAQ